MRIVLSAVVAAAALLAAAAPAAAYYGAGEDAPGAEIVADFDRLEQGDDSTVYAAVSADGRFVVVQTRARNYFADDDPDPVGAYRTGGVFRFELATRELEKVADGDLFEEGSNAFLRRGASNPSVSADGRFVAFATAEQLVPADVNGNVDVYVRDMDLPEDAAGAFDLVSARDGGAEPAAYGPPAIPVPGSDPGADLTRGVAISGDGRYVAFRTEVASDLPAGSPLGAGPGQVFVRDRQEQRTTLVTRTSAGGQPAGGAVGAAISADGTTVAWTGNNAQAQTRFLKGESEEASLYYYLWRRVADGPGAPTRRITGVADPDDPACPPEQVTNFDPTTEGPCFGPITEQESLRSSIISQVPALSGDGWRVAYLTGSGPRPVAFKGPGLDLFVTDMHPGLTRKEANVELTRATATQDAATSSPISGVAMAPDGRHLAITTSRTVFSAGGLSTVQSTRTVAGTRELYAIDLQEKTIDRVAKSYADDDINGDVQAAVTISDGGERIAFTSFAGNLFFGDANQRADAFVATLQDPPNVEPPPPPPPPPPPDTTENRLVVRAEAGRGGRTALRVQVPAAGGLSVLAKGRAGKPRGTRSLAKASGRAPAAGWIEVPLRLVERYRGELRERGRMRAIARLDFVPAVGDDRIRDSVGIVFLQKPRKGKGAGR